MLLTFDTCDELLNLISKEGVVFVLFSASFCGPCKKVKPFYEKKALECDKIKFVLIDVGLNYEIALHYNITKIPVLKVFKDGVEVDNVVGVDCDKLSDLLSNYENL